MCTIFSVSKQTEIPRGCDVDLLNVFTFFTGFFSLVVSLGALGLGFHYKKISIDFVYDKFLPLITSALVISLLFGIALHIKARLEKTDLAPGGNTGKF